MKKLLKTKKDKEQFITWIAWLKAGVFKKTSLYLQDNDGHCCLGVACELFIEHPLVDEDNHLRGGFPGYLQLKAPQWLKDINYHVEATLNHSSPSSMNDSLGWSHERIADRLLELYNDELYGSDKSSPGDKSPKR